jgi:excisionase family DNA binding protein
VSTQVEPLLLSASEAAQALGLGRTLTNELIRSGQLPSVRVGRRRLIRRDALLAFIDSLESQEAS